MTDNATARTVVDLALDDKPNKAGEAMNDILLNKISDKVQGVKDQIANELMGSELPQDAEPVEVQPELDLEPEAEEEEGEEYQADQEQIEEPDEVEETEEAEEVESEEEIEPETDEEVEDEEEENEIT